jgi:hypothetical protein
MKTFVCAMTVIGSLAALAASPAASEAAPHFAIVKYVPANSNPPIPAGLKVTCLKGPNVLTASETCPVVIYNGVTTWAYSYIDNRVSLALVSYDANNKVVANVEKTGTRYVWNADSSMPDKAVIFFGQSDARVMVPWSALGGP